MASIFKGNDRLVVDFRYRGVRCREQTHLTDTQSNRRKLQKVIDRMEAENLPKTFDYAVYYPDSPKVARFRELEKRVVRAKNGIPTFGEFAKIWFVECSVGWRHSHKETIRGDLDRRLLPRFAAWSLDEITKADVLEFRARLAGETNGGKGKGLAPPTINRILVALRSILNEGADRYEFTSPMRGIKSLKVPRSQVEPLTLEEVQRFLAAVREDLRPYYTVRFFTGCARVKSTVSNGSTSISSADKS